jgi:mRNA interferase RelE/StbE
LHRSRKSWDYDIRDHILRSCIKTIKKTGKKRPGKNYFNIRTIKIRPQVHVTKLVGDPGYRLRVGDYRVILDIDEGNLFILVINIGHRKKIYK